MGKKYDFSGWATKNNVVCSDGRLIRQNAFAHQNGTRVPLVWDHVHDDVSMVLGYADLENRPEGVIAHCSFNNTENGQAAKETVRHGDVTSLSIYANRLQHKGNDVVHGEIREVSLVLAGANPGARIDTYVQHDGLNAGEEEYHIFTASDEGLYLEHDGFDADESGEEEDMNEEFYEEGEELDEEELEAFAEEMLAHSDDDDDFESIIDSMNDQQYNAMLAVVQAVMEDGEMEHDDSEEYYEEDEVMKHNVFDTDDFGGEDVLMHADMGAIVADGKKYGSLKDSYIAHMEEMGISEEDALAHADGEYGIKDIDMLFPDYKNLNVPPEFIQRNMDWVGVVMNNVHHTPFSRIKSMFADITEDDARARGYIKDNLKKEEVFTLLKRTTDPQTIYKKQKFDRDDVLDITDFDVIAWVKAEMRMMLDEEIARAILVGDGRLASSEDKIQQEHVRSIYNDDDFYANKVAVKVSQNATEDEIAKKTIRAIIKARKDYKGSGNPTFFTTTDVLTDMLLLEDATGRIIYDTEEKLRTALRVSRIVEVEVMENQTRTDDQNVTRPLIGIVVNLSDYNVGADKGGAVNMFDDFDIDYNQMKYLIETRMSGALTKPHSAMVIELEKSTGTNG